MPNVDRLIKSYYDDQKPSQDVADKLLSNFPLKKEVRYLKFFQTAAIAALLVLTTFSVQTYLTNLNITSAICDEICLSFDEAFKVEMAFSNFSDLGEQMPKLNIDLVEADIRKQLPDDVILQGGRYTMINGQLVGQLMLIHTKTQERSELYVTTSKGRFSRLPSQPSKAWQHASPILEGGGINFCLSRVN